MVVIEAKTIAIPLLANPIVASFGYEKVIDLNFSKTPCIFIFFQVRPNYDEVRPGANL
jgi:hypothetical protein